jgi:hypothetical protein
MQPSLLLHLLGGQFGAAAGAAGGRVLVGDPAARGAHAVQPADGLATLLDRFHALSLPLWSRRVTLSALVRLRRLGCWRA